MKSTLRNMLLALGTLVIGAGAILGAVKLLTDDPIAEAARQGRIQAFSRVLGPFDNNPADTPVRVPSLGAIVYPATLHGAPAGAAVEITAPQGFGGPFTLIVGFDTDGQVSGYGILSHAETPGLGAKMDTWFCDTSRPSRSIIGLRPGSLSVSKDGGQVDAITGATITSRAFLDAINRAAQALSQAGNINQAQPK